MQFIHIMPFKSIFLRILVIDFTGYTYSKLSFDMTSHNSSNNFVTWPSMYITWNMVERKKWKQMIRPAIRNVFDSQSTRKSRATWSKKYKRISLSLPPQWSVFDNIIRKIASLDPNQFLGKPREKILRQCTNVHYFPWFFWAFHNYRRFGHLRQCFDDLVT